MSAKKQTAHVSVEYIKVFGPALFLTLVGFVVAYQFVEPAPPKQIWIGTGGKAGAYYQFGQRYREILARDGITLKVLSTAGSLENIRLLEANQNGVHVAFVQGGIGDPNASPQLESLASLYFEPLWVFHRAELSINRLSDLLGRRIAVGPEGSGTRALALQILSDNEITEELPSILPLGGKQAADAAIFTILGCRVY